MLKHSTLEQTRVTLFHNRIDEAERGGGNIWGGHKADSRPGRKCIYLCGSHILFSSGYRVFSVSPFPSIQTRSLRQCFGCIGCRPKLEVFTFPRILLYVHTDDPQISRQLEAHHLEVLCSGKDLNTTR